MQQRAAVAPTDGRVASEHAEQGGGAAPPQFTAVPVAIRLSAAAWAVATLVLSLYALHHLDFVRVLLTSAAVHRGWLNFALAQIAALLMVAGHLELWRGAVLGEQLSYASARTTTHAMLALLMGSYGATVMALCPLWGLGMALFVVLVIVAYGVLWNLALLVPSLVFRLAAPLLYVWFLQNYVGFELPLGRR